MRAREGSREGAKKAHAGESVQRSARAAKESREALIVLVDRGTCGNCALRSAWLLFRCCTDESRWQEKAHAWRPPLVSLPGFQASNLIGWKAEICKSHLKFELLRIFKIRHQPCEVVQIVP